MNSNYHIAVLDIGKTNKKILIFDEHLSILDEKFTRIPEIEQEGLLLDDVNTLKQWILETLSKLARSYNIRVISTSAHGATYALVDDNINSVVPQIAYNTDPGADFHEAFYAECGDPIALQTITATPNFNLLINPAKGIYFTKKKYPQQFSKAQHLLFYAQFFGSWLTGNLCADPTYVGNHSYLWDFEKRDWSEVADHLEVRSLLPASFKSPWDVLGTIRAELARETGLSEDTFVTVGIHDSNGSMLPYIVSMKEPFLLNSTGTWCVIMNEKEKVEFKEEELGKVVFYNMNAFWKPIKTAIFLGGMEFEHYANILQEMHQRSDFPSFDESVYQKILDECDKFILPSVAKGIGQFPDSNPRVIEGKEAIALGEIENKRQIPGFFRNYEEAFAVLNLSLAIQTKVSFERADIEQGMQVFTEGGFSKNDSYNGLLTSFYPNSRFYLTDLKEASAFGAAMCGKAAMERIDINLLSSLIHIERKEVPKASLEGVDKYYQKFISLI